MKRNWVVMNHLTLTFCLLILWSLAYIFSYNKKPKSRERWACLHECELRLLFPWEISSPTATSAADCNYWCHRLRWFSSCWKCSEKSLKKQAAWDAWTNVDPHGFLMGWMSSGLSFLPVQYQHCCCPDLWAVGVDGGCRDTAIGMDRTLDRVQWND